MVEDGETGENEPGDEEVQLSRRKVLAGVTGAAGVGALGGAGTRALFRDEETVPDTVLGSPLSGGRMDLELHCPDPGEGCRADSEGLSFAVRKIEPPATGETTACIGLSGEPAWVWLRTTPPVDRPLARALLVTFSYGDGTPVVDPSGREVEDRPLNDVFGAFADGGLLRGQGPDGAFAPSTERCLELSWSLPEQDPGLSRQSVEFTLRFAAVQYRADADARNPWRRKDE